MVARRIDVEPESEIAELLKQAKEYPIVIELEGQRFRLEHDATNGDTGGEFSFLGQRRFERRRVGPSAAPRPW